MTVLPTIKRTFHNSKDRCKLPRYMWCLKMTLDWDERYLLQHIYHTKREAEEIRRENYPLSKKSIKVVKILVSEL